MNKHYILGISILFIILSAFIPRIYLGQQKPILEHDDAISLLASSGHLDDVASILRDKHLPYHEVVPAQIWLEFIQSDGTFQPKQIAHDVSTYDRNAPLYYVVLHIWIVILGDSLWTTILLNIVIDVLIVLALIRFANQYFEFPYDTIPAIIWLYSPIALYSTFEIRPYPLFTLLTVLFVDTCYRLFFKPATYQFHLRYTVIVILVTVALFATHFNAVWVIGAAGLIISVRWLIRDIQRIVWFGIYIIIGFLLLLLIHPLYIQPIFEDKLRYGIELPLALERVLMFTYAFVLDLPYHSGNRAWMRFVLGGLFFVVPVILCGMEMRSGSREATKKWTSADAAYVFGLFILNYTVLVAVYLLGISSWNYRYLDYLMTFVALLFVFILHLSILHRFRAILTTGLVLLMIVSGILTTREINYFYHSVATPNRIPTPEEWVLINVGRPLETTRNVVGMGHIFQAVYKLDAQQSVFVSDRETLVTQPETWLPNLETYPATVLLGFPDNEIFAIIENAGYQVQPFASYMYYSNSQRVVSNE